MDKIPEVHAGEPITAELINRLIRRANHRLVGAGVHEGENETAIVVPQPWQVYWGKAQADWEENAGDPRVSVKLCDDRHGNGTTGSAFWVYLPRIGARDPQVYAARNADSDWPAYVGDVIPFRWDADGDAVVVGDYLGESLWTVKSYGGPVDEIPYGWHLCDGTNPAGNKLGEALPDSRGLYTRATDYAGADALWSDGSTGAGTEVYVGPADNTGNDQGAVAWGAGGRAGVTSSRQQWGASDGDRMVVEKLEDVQSWSGDPSDGDATPNNTVVVAPPTYVFGQIIRCK